MQKWKTFNFQIPFILNTTTSLSECTHVSTFSSTWLIQKLYKDLTGSDTYLCLWMSLWERGLLWWPYCCLDIAWQSPPHFVTFSCAVCDGIPLLLCHLAVPWPLHSSPLSRALYCVWFVFLFCQWWVSPAHKSEDILCIIYWGIYLNSGSSWYWMSLTLLWWLNHSLVTKREHLLSELCT